MQATSPGWGIAYIQLFDKLRRSYGQAARKWVKFPNTSVADISYPHTGNEQPCWSRFGVWAMGIRHVWFSGSFTQINHTRKPSPQITSACEGKHLFINSCFMTHARAGTLPMQELSRAPKGLPNFSYLS